MSKKLDLEIINYDTEYLDAIEGHVTDVAPAPAAIVPAQRNSLVRACDAPGRRDLSPKQQAVMAASQAMVGGALAMPGQLTGHGATDDNALLIAHAHNVASRPKLTVAAVVAGLLALAIGLFWQLGRSEFILITLLAGIAWGVAALVILQRDRAVALHHSAPGVEHHKIDAQADVQKTAVKSWETIMLAMIKDGDK